ncbi:MAG: ABC transporter permease [Piscinibacter sp.]|uniref:ABC transporter permease n=1 Tax=Piscinibacter sp. TaxID=1903157 RepID=UPI00258FF622|nr:ABC transporter permease [Piscinibacter sp.]MCW5666899.1 ABC transporter permease [Piscinibacter sp.]
MRVQSLPTLPRRRTPVQVQRSVLLALVIRELRARVEGRWLGLLWMMFEPLAHILIILALFGFRRHAVATTVELPVFLLTGLLPFFIFRNLARRLPAAISGNRGLYAYRQVKPIDAVAARAVVEIGLYSAVYLSALALLGWLGYHFLPHAPLELMVVSAVLLALGLGLGLVFGVLSHNRPRVQSIIGLAFLPLYLISGVIFPLHSLPPDVRSWLLWNPVLHLIELSRFHFIDSYQPIPGVGLAYPAAFALLALSLGLSLYRLHRHRLIAPA